VAVELPAQQNEEITQSPMQQTPAKTQKAAKILAAGRWLQVSRYDRASSMLLALLVTIGALAVLLFVIWLNGKMGNAPSGGRSPTLLPPLVRNDGEDGGDRRATGGTQLDTPSDEPVVGKDNQTSDVQENLSMLDVSAVSKAKLDDPEATLPTRHGSRGSGGGKHGGNGPGRGLGDGIGPPGHREDAALERHWEVVFSRSTLDAYAQQLDFFKIELGIILPDNKIIYVYNLAKSKPDSRVVANSAASENRYYLTWRNGEMQQADRELSERAGVDVAESFIVKFLPPQIEARLAGLEKEYAGANATRVRKTRFGVRASGGGFQFFVLEQSFKR
jgi:hypothetical protein